MKRVVITPETVETNYWKDVWNFRGLFYFLAWRDVAVRYKQTVIGVAWTLLKPMLTIGVFWFVGWLFKIPDKGVPRILMVASGILPWHFFSLSFSDSANSLIANSNLIKKVYFPRIIIPASTIIVSLTDFFFSLIIVFVIMIALQFAPSIQILALPLFLLLAIITSMGFGLFIAALNVKYRDFRFIVPFIVQFGLYVSPVAFSSDLIYNNPSIPAVAKFLYGLNPMVGVIDGFRWCITGGQFTINITGFVSSIAISVLMLVVGIKYFRHRERSFADDI